MFRGADDPIFQSTRPVRGGTTNACANGSTAAFQSTRPVRGGTITGLALALGFTDFNPPAPCGAGRDGGRARHPQPDFNPPAPCGAGLRQSAGDYLPNRYFNPPAPCGAGQHLRTQLNDMMRISIHPPRAGRDESGTASVTGPYDFNPPAPCGAGPYQ